MPAHDASLRQRGSLTVWFTDEAIAAWTAEPRTTRGGQPWYSPLAILTALTLRAVFRLAYRQAEGLIGSIISLLGLTLRVPDRCGDDEGRPPLAMLPADAVSALRVPETLDVRRARVWPSEGYGQTTDPQTGGVIGGSVPGMPAVVVPLASWRLVERNAAQLISSSCHAHRARVSSAAVAT